MSRDNFVVDKYAREIVQPIENCVVIDFNDVVSRNKMANPVNWSMLYKKENVEISETTEDYFE